MTQTNTWNDFFQWCNDIATWVYDVLIGFVRQLANGERMLLMANLCMAAVGAYSSYLFYTPSRGPIIGGLAAAGIEMLYLGGAGAAVRHRHQQVIAWALVALGTLASSFFGVMVSLTEAMPTLFQPDQPWPETKLWIVRGLPALVEGVLPPLCALLLSILLHSMVSGRLRDADKAERRAAAAAEPYICPFCTETRKTPAALYGHYGRCPAASTSDLTTEEKKGIIAKAVAEGNQRKEV